MADYAPSQEISKYNEANFQIMRLHDCWTKANHYARSGELHKWRWELDIIWRELYADVGRLKKKNEPEEIKKENKKLRNNIASARSNTQLYEALNERHEFLKELQDGVGKGGVYMDADYTGFE